MNADPAFWSTLADIALVPLAGAVIYLVYGMRDLLFMHKNPETTEFGTAGMRELITSNTQAFKELTRIVKWLIKEMGHSQPPPTVGDD